MKVQPNSGDERHFHYTVNGAFSTRNWRWTADSPAIIVLRAAQLIGCMGDKRILPVLIGPISGPVHGVSTINRTLRSIMCERDLDPGIIDLSPGSHPRGISYHITRSARTFGGVIRVLSAALERRRHRYVMSLDGGGGLFYNILIAMAVRATGEAVSFYHHSSRYVFAESALMRILLWAGNKAAQIFCSPEMARQFHARYGAQGEILVINNAAWVPAVALSGEKRGKGLVRLGFLSALNVEKGLGRAIETLRVLRQQGVFARLELAGAVSDAEASAILEAAQREFGADLLNRGVLQGQEKATFLASLDYFLFPSLYAHETQSLVVPEALSAGVPVIAFDHRFVGEVVRDGGLLIAPDDDFATRAFDWIVAGEDALQERRRRARAQFEAEHTKAEGQVERLIRWSVGAA